MPALRKQRRARLSESRSPGVGSVDRRVVKPAEPLLLSVPVALAARARHRRLDTVGGSELERDVQILCHQVEGEERLECMRGGMLSGDASDRETCAENPRVA